MVMKIFSLILSKRINTFNGNANNPKMYKRAPNKIKETKSNITKKKKQQF